MQQHALKYPASFVLVQIIREVFVGEHTIEPCDDIFRLPEEERQEGEPQNKSWRVQRIAAGECQLCERSWMD